MIDLEHTNSKESIKHHNKISAFVENTKKAVHKVIVATQFVASSLYPASINTIHTTFSLSSPIATTITIWTASSLLVACSDNTVPEGVKDTTPPTINILKPEVDVTWWKEIQIIWNVLYIWSTAVASRSDNVSKECTVYITINWWWFKSWDTISNEWTLTLKVTDQAGNLKTAEIELKLTKELSGLENLKNATLQVDQEIDLLKWITFANWVKLIKTEIQMDWERTIIKDPHHYTPEYPWECCIIFTIEWRNNTTTETRVDNITIKPLEYKEISINNTKPVDILPIIWQIEVGDKNAYDHIEHLRIAEATKIRDMMRKYGAGNHSPEQYQQLMMRLNTGMIEEYPLWYNNFDFIGTWEYWDNGGAHAHNERSILNSLLNHTNLKCVETFIKDNTNAITILWSSAYAETNKENFLQRTENDKVRELCKSKKLIIFKSGWNIRKKSWVFKNKSYHKDIIWDEHWFYSLQANANWKNDANADIALLVTVWTNAEWDVNQTGEITASSAFPVWFHDKVLFSWRAFPYHSYNSWKIEAEWTINNWKYATSFTNYVNVAIMDLCFQMFAEVNNVNELLNMVRSTCDTDYIRLDWQTQTLQLMNPAKFSKKYLMPTDLPAEIKPWEILPLNKWYYKWIIFDIPWSEVNINGEWIAYNNTNKNLIKNQNPFTLEWRLNWDLCKKLWYSASSHIQWKIILSDDNFNWLNITREITISYTK